MNKVEHERKRTKERKLMRKLGSNSDAWKQHKEAIARKVQKTEEKAHTRALERKKAKIEEHEKRMKAQQEATRIKKQEEKK
jgi:hypothetical protein